MKTQTKGNNIGYHKVLLVSLFCVLVFQMITSLFPINKAVASDWPGWAAINTIYYNPSQDDDINHYLLNAASELQIALGQFHNIEISTIYPPEGHTIILVVNAEDPDFIIMNDEAFKIKTTENNDVAITGKTAFACRDGAFWLLNMLGFWWLGKHSDWTIVPDYLDDSIVPIDILEEPDFIWREEFSANPFYDWTGLQQWRRRNLLGGPLAFRVQHSYYGIMPANLYTTYPDAYLPPEQEPNPDSTTDWQLLPTDPDVINHAISYGRTKAAETKYYYEHTGEYIPMGVVSISPNDGAGWGDAICPESGFTVEQTQYVTNLVAGLVNTVADDTSINYPDKYIGCYNYSLYSEVPTFNFTNNNVFYMVASAYDYTPLDDYQRIAGLAARGALVGIREYYDPPYWWEDFPVGNARAKLERIEKYFNAGTKSYFVESGDSWGGTGIIYWLAARMLWDTSLEVDDLVDQYCSLAFGEAKEPMLEFYQRLIDGQHVGDNWIACSIDNFREAESLTSNSDILDRIRYQELYVIFLNRWRYIDDMDISQMASFYSWASKYRDTYVLTWRRAEDVFHDILRDKFGYTEEQIASWFSTYGDYVPPSDEDISVWMNNVLDELSGIERITASNYVDPYDIILEPLGNLEYTTLSPLGAKLTTVVVRANASDIIECEFVTYSPFDDATFTMYPPGIKPGQGSPIDSVTVTATRYFVQHSFVASAGSGLYTISGGGGINVTSHPAGIMVGIGGDLTQGNKIRSGDMYFYVPEGTDSFLFEFAENTNTTMIYDPDNLLMGTISGPTSGIQVLGINSPKHGVWRLDYGSNILVNVSFGLYGIPAILWWETENMLSSPLSLFDADVTGDGLVNILDLINVAQHFNQSGFGGWIPEDINLDGIVNTLDIILVGQNWTG